VPPLCMSSDVAEPALPQAQRLGTRAGTSGQVLGDARDPLLEHHALLLLLHKRLHLRGHLSATISHFGTRSLALCRTTTGILLQVQDTPLQAWTCARGGASARRNSKQGRRCFRSLQWQETQQTTAESTCCVILCVSSFWAYTMQRAAVGLRMDAWLSTSTLARKLAARRVPSELPLGHHVPRGHLDLSAESV